MQGRQPDNIADFNNTFSSTTVLGNAERTKKVVLTGIPNLVKVQESKVQHDTIVWVGMEFYWMEHMIYHHHLQTTHTIL